MEPAKIHEIQSLELDFDLREAGGKHGVVENRRSIAELFGCDSSQLAYERSRATQARHDCALVCKKVAGIYPALAALADQVACRNPYILQEDFVDAMYAVYQYERTDGHSRGVHVDQEERKALLAAHAGRFYSQQSKHHIREMRVAGPHLVAVHYEVVSFLYGRRTQ